MAAVLRQIYFREEQKANMYPISVPYFNETLTIFFENTPIVECVTATKAEKIAVCSWKLKDKMRFYVGRPREITQEVLDTDYDVLSFTRNTKYHQFYDFGEANHKGFKETITKLLAATGIPMPHKVRTPIYQNHFSARTDIYRDYVNSYLIPAMEVMKNDPEVNKLIMMDSHYSKLAKNSAASPEYLQKAIGIPFYPLCPFILERLFSIYCHNKRINVTPL